MERQDAPVPAADVLLRDGGIAVIRPLVSGDLAEVRQLHVRASDDAIRLRFFSSSRLSGQLMTESTVKSLPVVVAERDRTAPALTPVRFVAPLNLRCPQLQFPQLQ